VSDVKIQSASPRSLAALNRLFAAAVSGHFDYFTNEVQRQVIRDHSVPKLLLATIDPRRVILTAKIGGRIIGYAIGAAPSTGPAQLFWLYVDPEFRGANTGLSLLSRMLKTLAEKGAREVSIATHDHRKYYERQGFKFIENKPVHGVNMDILVFRLGGAKRK
jgi:ribosomal protein S18 acetylase RimI-like enzyme